MKKKLTTIFMILIFLIGVSLLLYPTVSEFWNSRHQSQLIQNYEQQVSTMEPDRNESMWHAARAYNENIANRQNIFLPSDEEQDAYESLLNVGGTGIMGYIEIPSIDVKLPIYHGTDSGVLQVAVGHLDWTALPVGGEGTHSVLSGHRGLPSATLLTHLDRMVIGDIFHLRVLGERLSYQVDEIQIVKPEEMQPLLPVPGQDLVTLVTCTPYGVNSHRLLVRGHRVDFSETVKPYVTADAVLFDPAVVALAIAIPFLVVLLIVCVVPKRKKKIRRHIPCENESSI